MSEIKKHNYDESKIKTLSSLEHIRLRTGMYIGRIGNGTHYGDGSHPSCENATKALFGEQKATKRTKSLVSKRLQENQLRCLR